MSQATKITDFCSITLETKEREQTDKTPLEQYEPKGYAFGGDTPKATDAAVALTASAWGPPFYTDISGTDWAVPAYDCACKAVERQIIKALTEDS